MSQKVRLLVVVALALVGSFLILRLMSLGGQLSVVPEAQQPGLFAAGLLAYAITLLLYAFLWRSIVLRLDRTRPPLIDSMAVFCSSWLGRYVPSSLPYLAGKVLLGARLGHSKRALATSLLYENALIVAIAAVSSSVVIPIALTGDGGRPLLLAAAALGGVGGMVVLSPPVFHRLLNVATRIARREAIERDEILSYGGMVTCSLLTLLALAVNGTSFAFVLSAFVEMDVREFIAAAAAFNLAGAVGVAVLPVPSGLGVREAVLIGLLQLFVPLEIAAAAAVVARLVGIVVDVAFGVAGGALVALRRPMAPPTRVSSQRQLDAA